MKKTFAALALVLTGTSLAQAEMVAVERGNVQDYRTALSLAARATTLSCVKSETITNADNTFEGLEKAQSYWIDTSGAQPAILAAWQYNSIQRVLVRVVTTADYMRIVSSTYEVQELVNVNKGSLVAPKVEQEYVTRLTTICTAR